MVVMNEWNTYRSIVGIAHMNTKSHGKTIANAISMYADDYDGLLPPHSSNAAWQSLLLPYGRPVFNSHNPKGGTFVPNDRVAGYQLSKLDNDTIIASEENPWRDGEQAYVFADGSAKFLKAIDLKNLEPKPKAK